MPADYNGRGSCGRAITGGADSRFPCATEGRRGYQSPRRDGFNEKEEARARASNFNATPGSYFCLARPLRATPSPLAQQARSFSVSSLNSSRGSRAREIYKSAAQAVLALGRGNENFNGLFRNRAVYARTVRACFFLFISAVHFVNAAETR